MDMHEAVNADNNEQLFIVEVEETGDCCILDYTEIVPFESNTDGSCTTECVNGHWFGEVKQENLAVVKQEPHLVCFAILALFLWPIKNVPNFRMVLCNRAGEMNQQKSMYVMSKHLQICL